MTAGRPRTPNELKRRRGTDRVGRGVLPLENVLQLPQAEGTPPFPADLGIEGRRLWQAAWDQAVRWLSPASDMLAVERTCRLADYAATAGKVYEATHDAADLRVLIACSHELGVALGLLGFDPSARARIGVAEVTAASKMDKLRRDRPGG